MTVLYLNHTCSEDAIQVNHRDTMNTEKNRTSPAGVGSADGDPISPYPGFTFLSTTTLRKPRGPRGYCRCWAVGRGTKNYRQRCALRPGGTPQEISRGQARTAGAAPRFARPNVPCPSGASKKFLATFSPQFFRHRSSPQAFFFDAPLGHGARWLGFRGRRPLGRTCPPANFLRRPSGTGTGRPRSQRLLIRGDAGKIKGEFRWCRCDWGSAVLRRGCGFAAQQCARKIFARREDFARRAGVCAETQPQRVGCRRRR